MVYKEEKNEIKSNEALIENLNHNDPSIRRKAALALEKKSCNEALIPLLNTCFKGSSYLIPKIIGKIGKGNIKLLLEIASNNDIKIRIRQYAIEGLGRIGDNNILKDLFELINDNNIFIRKSVISALAYIGDNNSVEILLNLLEREDDWIKKDIIWALGIIGEYRCVDKLIKMLSKKNLRFLIKKNIVDALGRIGDKRAVEILVNVLKDQYFGLEDYALSALENIIEKNELYPTIEKNLIPLWRLKEQYEKIFGNLPFHLRRLLKDYEFKIYRREELPPKFFENIKDPGVWHFGYLNHSHYILNLTDKIIGCLNLIFLFKYNNTYLFYFDTLEIQQNYRKIGLGSKFVEFMIQHELKKYDKYIVFLLVAKCIPYKLKFFTKLGFVPVKLRKTGIGTHCIMSYPFDENSGRKCQKLFEFFNWREEKKEFISSDCKYAYNPNPTGLYWCIRKNIYVSGLEKQSCQYYVKGKKLYFEEKVLDLSKSHDKF
ncbi:MAG: GNAT family N-acetyltransferase [Promethearchaeota archaeon]